ncbi:uroporphyrinogen-III synthase [Pseudomonas sp. N040]|uniref:uroporphyrinogen-III synthase n=1 Tax=Pseudomonas sp. N040 TaxID=2785325 RepID=UPI0018A29BEE|nr:uroporphyrinogen-III synthase [Pseudomonas sp. N040]MBF7730143.1 uroporphyrinogen-III synthase [Pseudomonas sp. N040]MBW7013785.1 uroporphyrinogen-III synthase [Pseudomonas sp. N040]
MSAWRLLLTRPAEEAKSLAATLAEHGVFTSSLPLLAIQALPETPGQRARMLDLERYAAVIVVSKAAARLGLERLARYWPQPPQQPWFSVGAATGRLLADHGLNACWPASGEDSEALLQLPQLRSAVQVAEPRVLIIKGEGGRELLAERLRAQGVTVDYLCLYRRTLPDYPAGSLCERIRAERLNGLLVSSGQGLEHLRQLAAGDWPQLAGLPLFVPSQRVAAQARAAGAQHVVDCRGASAAALLDALQAEPVPAH